MGGMSAWHWIIVAVVLMLLFGRGKFSDMMGDVAKGIKSFKKGMAEEEQASVANPSPSAPPSPTRIDATAQGGTVIEGEATKSSESKI